MKNLKVTSVGEFGEQTVSHPIVMSEYEEMLIVAILRGVNNAGHAIKSFEIVEV